MSVAQRGAIMTEATYPQIIYPESDGQPMTESDATRDYLIYCVAVLETYFRSRRSIYVSGNLLIYYQEGNSKRVISPDVFVIFGVSQRQRRSYKTWDEGGKLPQFILEVTSHSTRRQDEVTKPELYASLGVQEYFQYDPTGDYLTPQLKGSRLVDGVYQPLELSPNDLGLPRIYSDILGLDLCLQPIESADVRSPSRWPLSEQLRFYDPRTGEKLLSYSELVESRETERRRADEAQLQANRLAERLRALGIDPDDLGDARSADDPTQ